MSDASSPSEVRRRQVLTVLHLLAPAPAGGLETVVRHLSRAQACAGHQVAVAPIGPDRARLAPFLAGIADSVDTRFLQVPDHAYLQERRQVRKLCRELRPDIVHTHGYRPDVADAGVARELGIATVSTVHGFTGKDLKNRFYEWLQRRAFRRFEAIVAVSRPLARDLAESGVPEDRIHTVRNEMPEIPARMEPDEARLTLGVERDAFHLGWVGRLSHEKGPDVLLDAVARLGDISLVASFVGDGEIRGALEDRADAMGIASRVRWHGTVPEAASLFPAFDLFVLSSRTEGTPMVLFEAMSAMIPVVATEVGGVPDVLTSGTGLLVPPDDPDALARAIRQVHDDLDAAGGRAETARDVLAEGRSAEGWVEGYDAVYRAAMRRAAAPDRWSS